MVSDDGVGTSVEKLPGQEALVVAGAGVALDAPVDRDDHRVGLRGGGSHRIEDSGPGR